MIKLLARIAADINWRGIRIRIDFCPLCNCKRILIKFGVSEMAVRCLSCHASAPTMSIVSVLRNVVKKINSMEIYEMSSRGPLYKYLKNHAKKLTYSEYFSDIVSGKYKKNVQCQDVQNLTYSDESFDICTSTEVFEHVPDDSKGFSEIYRVLRPNGILVFTVPLHQAYETVERAILTSDGEVKYILPPEYHEDPLRGSKIIVFRNYGVEIKDRLRNAGFRTVTIEMPVDKIPWGHSRPIVVAYKGNSIQQNYTNELVRSD
jgi:SAM-dependent methyltransferase